MLDSRCPEAVRGELHTAVADLAGVAAWMSFDGLAHHDSRRLFRVAVGCLGEYDWHLRAMLLEVSAELLGHTDDDALRATQEAEPVDVLVLRDLADEFGTVAAQAGNDVVDV